MNSNSTGARAWRADAKEPRELVRQRKRLNQGRGGGDKAEYQPYLQIERSGFQSRGRSHLVYNPSTGRQHHLLSDLELLVFIWAWSLGLADCREQYPLQLHDFDPLFPHLAGSTRGTLRIAADLGVRHPAITRRDPRVFTTDLLLTFNDRTQIALHAKYRREQEQATPRSLQLRRIEQAYWRERGVRFLVASEQPFTRILADRMMWAIDGMRWRGCAEQTLRFINVFEATPRSSALSERLRRCSVHLSWSKEQAVQAFKFFVLTGRWRARQLEQQLDLSVPWPGRSVPNFVTPNAWTARMPTS